MSEKIYYKVEEQQLKRLVEYALLYQALRQGGVNNWEWCGESISDFIDGAELRNIDLEPGEEKEMEHLVRDQLLEYEVLEDR